MDDPQTNRGLMCGIAAHALWGMIPLYFKSVGHVAPLEILAHRIIWSLLFLAGILFWWQRWGDVARVFRSPRVLLTLTATTVLIGVNWLTYITAVSTGQVLQASLGYFITPLMNVLLGVVVLHERMRRVQMIGIALAAAGVLNLAIVGGQWPLIALTLATSFSTYGLLRKTVAADGLTGVSIESMLLFPPALGYLLWLGWQGTNYFGPAHPGTSAALLLSGPITAVPLLLFAAAARRLRYATMGILQYLTPTLQFLLAVLAFGEPFSRTQLASFACIWGAVGIYTADSLMQYRRNLQPAHPLPESGQTPIATLPADRLVPSPCGQE